MFNMGTQGNSAKQLTEMLDLIKDADKLQNRLAELNAAEEAADKARKALTKAKDLDAAIQKANEKQIKLDALISDAQSVFNDKEAEATKNAEAIVRRAKQEAGLIHSRAEAHKKEVQDLRDCTEFEKNKAENLRKDVEAELEDLKSKGKQLEETRAMYLDYVSKVRELAKGLGL